MLRGATRGAGADGMNTTGNRIGGCQPTVASDLKNSAKSERRMREMRSQIPSTPVFKSSIKIEKFQFA
jgi:hypothetical protein